MLLDTDTQRPGNISRAPLHGSSALGTAVPFRRSLAQGSIECEQSKTRESRRRRHHQAPRASVARAERIRRAVYGLASCITRYEVATSRYRNLELDSTRRVPSLITLRFASTRGTRVHPELRSHFTVRVTRSTVGSTRIAVTVRGASARAVAGTAVGCGGLATVCSHSDRCPRHPLVCQGGANLLPSKHCPPSSECQTERDHRGRLPGTPR